MSEKNIKPAIDLQSNLPMPNEMSASEFQKRLYDWFEDRGLLAEVRAHLRKQMISALKDTAIGRTITGQQKHTISPKLQALNLLIAEFLLYQDYHYSLSVFSTEVPLINVLPEFQGFAVNHNLGNNSKKWQFPEKDMWDILETLGITQESDEGQNIYSTYYNSNCDEQPLLTCIVRMLPMLQNKSRTSLKEAKSTISRVTPSCSRHVSFCIDSQADWMKSIYELLTINNVNSQSISEITAVITNIIDTAKKRLEEESRVEFLKLQTKLQAQADKNKEEKKKKLLQLSNSLSFEKSSLESEEIQRQANIDNLKAKLHKQQNVLRERCQKIYARERDLREKEYDLQERERNLKEQRTQLQRHIGTVVKEQTAVLGLRTKLEQEIEEKQLTAKNDAEFLKSLQEECSNMKNEISDAQKVLANVSNNEGNNSEHDAEQELMTNLVKRLEIENANLRSINSEQQGRIEELSHRTTILMRDLENTQATVDMLSSHRHRFNGGIVSGPLLVAPPTVTHHRNGINSYNSGGGEDGSRIVPPPPSREYRNYPSPRDIKRRMPPRRLTVHSSSSTDDNTPTNDILQEARERLRRLEEESNEVDRHYKQFRRRRTEEGNFSPSRYLRHSSFGQAPCFTSMANEYKSLFLNHDTIPTSQFTREERENIYQEVLEVLNNIPGPSRNNSSYSRENLQETKSSYDNKLNCEVSKKDKPNDTSLSKYLKQTNNFNLSQTAIRDSDQRSPENYTSESDINMPGPSNIRKASQVENSVEKDVENNENPNRNFVELSFDSSGVCEDILEAGTSGVSLSSVDISNKSESQPESSKKE